MFSLKTGGEKVGLAKEPDKNAKPEIKGLQDRHFNFSRT